MNRKVTVVVPIYNVEKYIGKMLDSLTAQDYENFEALLIDDGSTDGSARVAAEYCRRDDRLRLISKKNGGVASARNMGIDEATGDFIVFWDPDDYVPPKALRKMYSASVRNDADMTVGIMQEESLGETSLYMHSVKLAAKKEISASDSHFLGAWSVCNKMFRMSFLRRHALRFENIKYAEDGVFTFTVLNRARRITGCSTIAYRYIRRPFWEAPSATQKISREYLSELLTAHMRILQEASKLAALTFGTDEKKINNYLEPLYVRLIEHEMLGGYFRRIWKEQGDMLPLLNAYIKKYEKHISNRSIKALRSREKDIYAGGDLISKEDMAANPLVSVILTENLTPGQAHMTAASLYSGTFPRFELLMPKTLRTGNEDVTCYENVRILECAPGRGAAYNKKAVCAAKSDMVMIIEEPVIFTGNTLRRMWNVLSSGSFDFVSVNVKHLGEDGIYPIGIAEACFGQGRFVGRERGVINRLDPMMSNKLIQKSAIAEKSAFFSDDAGDDSQMLYALCSFRKLRRDPVLTAMTEDELKKNVRGSVSPFGIAVRRRINSGLDAVRKAAGRIITREDINRLKRLFRI